MLGDNCAIINAPRTSHRSPFGILERTFHQLMSCTSAPLWPPWVERPGRCPAGCFSLHRESLRCRLQWKNLNTQQCDCPKKIYSALFFFFAGYCRLLQTSTNTSLSVLKHLAAMLQEVSSAQDSDSSSVIHGRSVCLKIGISSSIIQSSSKITFVCSKRAPMINLA